MVVGAGAGGDSAAVGLSKQGYGGEILLVGLEEHRPYERPALSKRFLSGAVETDRVFLRPHGQYQTLGINHLPGRRVVDGDPGARRLNLDDGETVEYDQLVLATGSTPRTLPDTPQASNILTLRSLRDGTVLKDKLAEARSILIVGAGFIGAEVAATARGLDKEVLVVEMAPVPLERVLGREVGEVYAGMHRRHGVDLRTSTHVVHWGVRDGKLHEVELADGTSRPVDVALIAVGVTPNVELAQKLALDAGPAGVSVDETLQAAPGIFAVGDIASQQHPVFNRRIRVEHWQVAQRQGTAVAASIAGEPAPYTELPWFWSDQYDVNLQYVGNAVGFDQTIVRGDLAGDAFSIFYLKAGVLDAVLSFNDGRTGRFSRPLISGRRVLGQDTLTALRDPSADLRHLANG